MVELSGRRPSEARRLRRRAGPRRPVVHRGHARRARHAPRRGVLIVAFGDVPRPAHLADAATRGRASRRSSSCRGPGAHFDPDSVAVQKVVHEIGESPLVVRATLAAHLRVGHPAAGARGTLHRVPGARRGSPRTSGPSGSTAARARDDAVRRMEGASRRPGGPSTSVRATWSARRTSACRCHGLFPHLQRPVADPSADDHRRDPQRAQGRGACSRATPRGCGGERLGPPRLRRRPHARVSRGHPPRTTRSSGCGATRRPCRSTGCDAAASPAREGIARSRVAC